MSSAPYLRCPPPLEESWLAKKLDAPALFAGVTTIDDRRSRARERINALGRADRVVGHRVDGKPETYAQLFARMYGEPL